MAPVPNVQANHIASAPRGVVQPKNSLRIGSWSCDQLIHDSGQHQLYAARPHDRGVGWPLDYVVKVLRRELETNRILVESLRLEASLGCQVTDSHLAPVITAQLTDSPFHIVYPRLPGTALSTWLYGQTALTTTVALWVARQTSEALQVLHRAGWLHGDVKPDNIVIAPNGHGTLIDLGSARQIGASAHVAESPFLSTLQYAAPECYCSRLATDVRSDIYSVGIVLFECLTGSKPFDGGTAGAVIDAQRRKPAPDLRRVKPDLPAAVVQLVRSMLAKDPLRRPHSTKDLIRHLIVLEIDTLRDHAT